MKVIIDRFEGGFAICEKPDRSMIKIPRGKLPPSVKEGDVIVIAGDTISIDLEGTARKKKEAEDLMKHLWK